MRHRRARHRAANVYNAAVSARNPKGLHVRPAIPASNAPGDADRRAETRNGIVTGILCYVFWGLAPIFWKALDHVNPFEIIANRVVWCLVFTVAVCRVAGMHFAPLLHDKRALAFLAPAGLVVTFNWSTYIYAVNTGHLVESALGYYINPLVSILFGRLFFAERLSRTQTAATLLMAAGVVWFTLDYGHVPWFALLLALSFALYSVLKKKGGYEAIPALAVESVVSTPVALAIGVMAALASGGHSFLADTATAAGWGTTLMLVLAGPVTAIPLMLFAQAANRIPLSLIGFIQYVSPTISLLLGVFAYGEAFTTAHLVCFGCIWCGLALVSLEAIRAARTTEKRA